MFKPLTSNLSEKYGIKEYEWDWDDFYKNAAESKESFLIKTHFFSKHYSLAFYVFRDGRLATESYLKHYVLSKIKNFNIDNFLPTLFYLLVGRDYYGDWSNHFQSWKQKQILLLDYEVIVQPEMDVLEKIARFIGYTGEVKPFTNSRIHSANSERAKSKWSRPSHRSEVEENLFLSLHGSSMVELGYIEESEYDYAKDYIGRDVLGLAQAAHNSARERFEGLKIAAEKEGVIQTLLRDKYGKNQTALIQFAKKLVRKK